MAGTRVSLRQAEKETEYLSIPPSLYFIQSIISAQLIKFMLYIQNDVSVSPEKCPQPCLNSTHAS